jgi:hypothetical protein
MYCACILNRLAQSAGLDVISLISHKDYGMSLLKFLFYFLLYFYLLTRMGWYLESSRDRLLPNPVIIISHISRFHTTFSQEPKYLTPWKKKVMVQHRQQNGHQWTGSWAAGSSEGVRQSIRQSASESDVIQSASQWDSQSIIQSASQSGCWVSPIFYLFLDFRSGFSQDSF